MQFLQIRQEEYKETELGLLPKEWTVAKVSEVFEFSKKPKGLNISEDAEITFIAMENISETKKHVNYEIKEYSKISSGVFVLKNDLIISKITPCFENGKQAILDDIPENYAIATTEVIPVHPKNCQVLNEHLYAYLKIPEVRQKLITKMEGTTGRKRLSKTVLANFLIPLPTVPEQQKIAYLLSTIQEAGAKTENVINSLKELKKSLMKHLFTYGAVGLEDAETVELKDTEIGKVPERWDVVKLGDIVDTYSGGTPNRGNKSYWEKGTIPWAKSGELRDKRIYNVEEKITEEGLENSSAKFVDMGDLLVAMYGATAGKVGLAKFKFTINQAICGIRPNEKFDSEFYFYYLILIRDKLLAQRFGGAQPNINQQIIKSLRIPNLSLQEQQKIASVLSVVDAKIEAEEEKKKALDELFKSMLHNLMSAKIRVNDLEIGA